MNWFFVVLFSLFSYVDYKPIDLYECKAISVESYGTGYGLSIEEAKQKAIEVCYITSPPPQLCVIESCKKI
jgi:hypothetical protein